MSQTTGTGAKKILGSDNWRDIFDIHNDTVDAYDGKIGTASMPTTAQTLTGAVAELDGAVDKVADGLAIIANGNTHAAITAGQFVYIRKHDSLAEGLYKATANVAANGTLSSSNVTADPSGGLNALNEQIGNIDNGTITASSGWTLDSTAKLEKKTGVVFLEFQAYVASLSAGTTYSMATIGDGYRPNKAKTFPAIIADANGMKGVSGYVVLSTGGSITLYTPQTVPTGTSYVSFCVSYLSA